MPQVDLNASLIADSSVNAPLGVHIMLTGSTGGSASLSSPAFIQTILFSGLTGGSSLVTYANEIDFSGTIGGNSSLSSPVVIRLHDLSGRIFGASALFTSEPRPIHGLASVVGLLVVIEVLPPLCPQPPQFPCPPPKCHAPPKLFRWGHVFSRFDLPLCITDFTGVRESPFEVTFTIYQVVSGNELHQVGPSNRKPVNQSVGEFYATGIAGEFGQPGDFMIIWSYRKTFNGPVLTASHPFRVVDAVLKPIPGDITCRVCKFGWD